MRQSMRMDAKIEKLKTQLHYFIKGITKDFCARASMFHTHKF